MRFVIVTGVSGAGKSTVLKMLEDAHYFCVDNLPIPLVEKFASLMLEVHEEGVQNAALGIDARSGRALEELAKVLDHMKEAGYDFEILFMDAEDSVLVKVYKAEADEAFATAKLLAHKEGILVGISSGAALSAAINYAKKPENKGKVIVALLPDTGDRYYSTPLFTE